MTQEEKDLLLKDISARLPYGLKVCCINLSDEMPKVWDLIGMPALHLADILVEGSHRFAGVNIEKSIRPYLRPMSSMTEEERKKYYETMDEYTHRLYPNSCDWSEHTEYSWTIATFDWLNKKMFDYRGLIPMGLAISAPEGMYKI